MHKLQSVRVCLFGAVVIVTAQGRSLAQPVVPVGFDVEIYATVAEPRAISFDPAGVLYVGNGNNTSNVHIRRVGIGGSPVADYGDTLLRDPDAVVSDAAGTIAGTAGSVLVGGAAAGGTPPPEGYLVAILPDETTIDLFGGATTLYRNPSAMEFDSTGRLVFTDAKATGEGFVFVSSGATPTVLFNTFSPFPALAIDDLDRIYTIDSVGQTIEIHDSSGSAVDLSFATIATTTIHEMDVAPAGPTWGGDLYATGVNGEIFRIDDAGSVTVFGSGFNNPPDLRFVAAEDALYVASDGDGVIYRITGPGVPVPAVGPLIVVMLVLLALTGLAVIGRRSV